MNCIDAIEGVAKSIILELHQQSVNERRDDSEYVGRIKTIIEGTNVFVENNREVATSTRLLRDVLYAYSKDLWMDQRIKDFDIKDPATDAENDYYDYYYSQLYHNGVYPK